MKFPDTVEVLRPYGPDEYGNPDNGWNAPTVSPAVAFLISKTSTSTGETAVSALMPATADVKTGDRVRTADGVVYDATVDLIRSPSKSILISAVLTRVPEAA